MSTPVTSSPTGLSLRQRFARIELLVVDVDGVLTEGGIVYGESGGEVNLEVKAFHVRDGSGLKLWQRAGKRSAVITGRTSALVRLRAAELGVGWVFQGAADKREPLAKLLAETGVAADAVCYVGDDLPDVAPMKQCGLAVAVADACADARAVAHYITRAPGGRGAVREIIERILRCQGAWPDSTSFSDKGDAPVGRLS
jgi:3-deoxy-D-manno-octulosonate 8-phosphate phosphatase (KDO 8-P phosphatase)